MTGSSLFENEAHSLERDTAFVIHPDVPIKQKIQTQALSGSATERNIPHDIRDLNAVLEETEGLARAINLDVVRTEVFPVSRIRAGTFLGKGQCEMIADLASEEQPDVIIVNYALSPVQQRNLEKEWDTKVIDRTGLILEIFGARAQTKEGRLQVDLAALEYQRSRLVRSWTHLERQRGGAGFMGGPGERQIELDRRMIGERINALKKELKHVRRTRELGRKSRERVPFPIVSLVGYTNAGKSTLFNRLTDAGVFAEDLPFATLDPTMRRIDLPNGQRVILSDTVGFISDLPTHLIESFRATLEQITYADVIVHIIDVARADYEAQRQDVINILGDLGIAYDEDERIVEVYNKIDMMDKDELGDLKRHAQFSDRPVLLISAVQGQGVNKLLQKCADLIARHRTVEFFDIPVEDGRALAWLYEHTEIIERNDNDKIMRMCIMIEPEDLERFKKNFGYTPLQNHKARSI